MDAEVRKVNDDCLLLKGKAKEMYLSGILLSLDKLVELVPQIDYKHLQPHIIKIRDIISFFDYKRLPEHKVGIPQLDEIAIDPTLCGFPNSEWYRKIYMYQKSNGDHLASLPSLEQIMKDAKEKIFNNASPSKEQDNYASRNFFQKIKTAELPAKSDFDIKKVKCKIEEEVNYRRYRAMFSGLDVSKNLFIMYAVDFLQDAQLPEIRDETHPFVQRFQDQCFGMPEDYVFKNLTFIDGGGVYRPQTVELFVVGPYYCKFTQNAKEVDTFFSEFENPFFLRFRKQSVSTQKAVDVVRENGSKKKTQPCKVELCGSQVRDEYVLCHLELKKRAEELFANEESKFKVYGITKEGGLIG